MNKRISALFLTAAMLLSLLSAAAFAEEGSDGGELVLPDDPVETPPVVPGEPEESIIASGTCGEALTWTLDNEGLLTISGTGEMMDNCNSWESYKDSILSIVIEPGATSIGINAFFWFSNLESITIPDTVTSIGERAFERCISLTSVYIPESVTSICTGSFVSAFYSCPNLTEINVAPGNAYYSSIDGVLFNKSKTTLLQYAIGKPETSYSVPDGVTSIGDGAFFGCEQYLTSIILPDGVTSVSRGAFAFCEKLTSINIPVGVTSIDAVAFRGCRALPSITIPGSVTSIGIGAFYWCSSLNRIVFAGNAPVFEHEPPVNEQQADDAIFLYVSATAYYPANNDTWTEAVRQNYGGNLTWVAYEPGQPGDANGDGDISVKDVVLIMRHIAGDTVELNTDAADVNKDGTVSVKDVVLIMRFIAGDNVTLG